MRILLVNYECPPLGGGGGVACYEIAKELAKKHHVDYLTTGYKGLPQKEQKDGIMIFRVPVIGRNDLSTATLLSLISFFPSCFVQGILLCSKNNYDIINAHFVIPSGLPAVFLAKLFKKTLIISVHGGDIYDPSKKLSPHRYTPLRILIAWLLRQADFVVAQSSNTKENTIQFYKYQGTIEIIPLGFTQPEFQQVDRKYLNLPENEIIFVSVGRLVKRKGYEYAIHALGSLDLDKYTFKYLIIGDGPEERFLKSLARELNIEENVVFLGYVQEELKYQYLSQSDVYLLPSLHEGFGICLLEAMYCGLPIVATNNGGQTDFLIEGRNALLVPIKDWQILAEKIDEICSDELKMKRMSVNNKKDIKRYLVQNIATHYEEIFSKRSRVL